MTSVIYRNIFYEEKVVIFWARFWGLQSNTESLFNF